MESNKYLTKILCWAREYKIDDILMQYNDKSDDEITESLLNLKSLNLSFKGLCSIPIHLFSLTSIEHLDLSHNQLEYIPTKIIELKKLKSLDISWNHITHNLDFLSSGIKLNNAWNRK